MSQGISNALKVIVLTRHIREYLELYDPQALKQATEALVANEPDFAAKLTEAREHGTVTLDGTAELGYEANRRRTDELLGRTAQAEARITHDGDDLDEEFSDHPEVVACPACVNGYGNLLGALGNRVHFRCRNCGVNFSVKS